MPKKLDKCVEKLIAKGMSKDKAFAICNKAMTDAAFNVSFSDMVYYDAEARTVISVRDGVQEYMGYELNMSPPDKVFQIYRSPETIREFAGEMEGLPITDDHVPIDAKPVNIMGAVIDARIIDALDEETKTTLKIRNKIQLDRETEKRQLSLGYHADLIPCTLYDFEQVDIVPHHLAIVDRGRCGETCKFTDKEMNGMAHKKDDKLNAAFVDADGQINMQQVLQLVADLPEVVKTLPLKELQKLAQLLTKAMDVATAEIAVEAAGEPAEPTEPTEPAEPGSPTEPPREVTKELEDEDEEAKKKEMTDSITDAAKKLNEEYATVFTKAKQFLPDNYDFSDKCACDIMRDALATQHSDKFKDEELPTAFKMLKKVQSYQDFGDAQPTTLADIGEKEL